MNIKQKIKLYDRLYRHADKLVKRYNPCQIKNGKCLNGKICCDDCHYLTEKGCIVACLMCKLFLCWRVNQRNPILGRTFIRMQIKAHRHGLLHLRYSKKEVITILQRKKKGK